MALSSRSKRLFIGKNDELLTITVILHNTVMLGSVEGFFVCLRSNTICLLSQVILKGKIYFFSTL